MYIDVYKTFPKIRFDAGGTDNTLPLFEMREQLLSIAGPHKLIFPSDVEMWYTNNKWTYGLSDFTLIGNNTTIRSMYDGDDDEAQERPLFNGELMQNNVWDYHGTKIYNQSSLFKSCSAGSLAIELKTPLDIQAGNRAFIYGFDLYGRSNNPPLVQYWEYVVIDRVIGDTVYLKMPLRNSYDEEWPDNPDPDIAGGGVGKPRIFNLDRIENKYCRHAKFVGINFGNSIKGTNGNFVYSAEHVEAERCTADNYFWASGNKTAIFSDMLMNKAELDKWGDLLIMNRVRVREAIGNGASIYKIVANDCDFGTIFPNPRILEINGGSICANRVHTTETTYDPWVPHIADAPQRSPMILHSISGVTFTDGRDLRADSLIEHAPFQSFIIDELEENNILTDSLDVVKTILPNTTVLVNEGGSNGGLVTGISYKNGKYIISGQWGAPSIGEVWRWSYIKTVVDKGGHIILSRNKTWGDKSLRWRGNRSRGNIHTMTLTQDDFTGRNRTIDLYGYILGVRVCGQAGIEIQNVSPYESIPLDYIGRKWVKQFYLIGSGTGKRFDLVIEWQQY